MNVLEVILYALPEKIDQRVKRAVSSECSRRGISPDREWGPKPSREEVEVLAEVLRKAKKACRSKRT